MHPGYARPISKMFLRKRRVKNIVRKFLVSTLVVASVCGSAIAAEADWVVGRWEMVRDPDGNSKDWMEFSADGKAISISPQGQRTLGSYSVSPQSVDIIFSAPNGRSIPIAMVSSADKKELQVRSTKTGNFSTYQKMK